MSVLNQGSSLFLAANDLRRKHQQRGEWFKELLQVSHVGSAQDSPTACVAWFVLNIDKNTVFGLQFVYLFVLALLEDLLDIISFTASNLVSTSEERHCFIKGLYGF